MSGHARRLMTSQKRELWKRWRSGDSISEISRALQRTPAAIFSSVRHEGGFLLARESAPHVISRPLNEKASVAA